MPISSRINRRPIIGHISRRIALENAKSIDILDLGIGLGVFGQLIKKKIRIPVSLTGVEIWEKYRNRRWKCYDEVIIEDVRTFVEHNYKQFDAILLIDLLEHLDQPDGQKLLNNIVGQAKGTVIVSTPVTEYPQGSYKGNPYEQHRYFWKDDDLQAKGFRCISHGWTPTFSLRPFLARLAVYALDKPLSLPRMSCGALASRDDATGKWANEGK